MSPGSFDAFDWVAAAGNLASDTIAEQFDASVRAWLSAKAPSGKPWLVACSGGADSVFLSLLIAGIFRPNGQNLVLVYFNHLLRPESDSEEEFVVSMAGALGIDCRVGRWQRTAAHTDAIRNLESLARAARYEFFNEVARDVGAELVLTGHHSNDVAENMIMRIARGSSWYSLSNPWPVRSFSGGLVRVRPLLSISSAQIKTVLARYGVPWMEDASNDSMQFTRNVARKLVVPQWEKVYPNRDLYSGVQKIRAEMQALEEALDGWVAKSYGSFDSHELLDLLKAREACGNNPALLKHLIRRWLGHAGFSGNMRMAMVDAAARAVFSGEVSWVWSLSETERLVLDSTTLRLEQFAESPAWFSSVWQAGGFLVPGMLLFGPDGTRLTCDSCELAANYPVQGMNPELECLCSADVKLPLRVRCWVAGDAWQPLGLKGRRRKLQDEFTNRKISQLTRQQLPVIEDADGNIVWVPGFPVAYHVRLEGNTPKLALRLTYTAI
ncbi:MAG: tRNA lysidine(34) synthetase TilS [Verrucomicrobia bacterium]|nr:tRNA lysidine(34) synthetase TilS [Verrucomicrobiota bacterium]